MKKLNIYFVFAVILSACTQEKKETDKNKKIVVKKETEKERAKANPKKKRFFPKT